MARRAGALYWQMRDGGFSRLRNAASDLFSSSPLAPVGQMYGIVGCRKAAKLSEEPLRSCARMAVPGMGRRQRSGISIWPIGYCFRRGNVQHARKLQVDNFVPHCIQYQLGDRMKVELAHDIA